MDYVIMADGLPVDQDVGVGGVMLILDSLVKKSFFEEVSFHPDLIDKKEPSRQRPWPCECGNNADSYKACKLV